MHLLNDKQLTNLIILLFSLFCSLALFLKPPFKLGRLKTNKTACIKALLIETQANTTHQLILS